MLRISISHPLPPRPHRPSRDELRRVFGGCNESGACTSQKDCCTGYGCQNGQCTAPVYGSMG